MFWNWHASSAVKFLKNTSLVCAILCMFPSDTHAQGVSIEWDRLNKEAMDLWRAGKYDHAVLFAQKALHIVEQNVGPDDPDMATSLNNLAELYRIQGDYAKAEPLYKRSLAISEKAFGPDHPDMATILENLASLYRATERSAEAQVLEQRARHGFAP